MSPAVGIELLTMSLPCPVVPLRLSPQHFTQAGLTRAVKAEPKQFCMTGAKTFGMV